MTPSQPTTPSAVLEAIAERLEAATGPDRELDYELAFWFRRPNWRQLKPWKRTNGWAKPNSAKDLWAVMFYGDGGDLEPVPLYTASLDAALSLVEAKLPGMQWDVCSLPSGGFQSVIDDDKRAWWIGKGSNPARAVLSAAFAVLAAKSTGEKEAENNG